MRLLYVISIFSLLGLTSASGMNQACLSAGESLEFIQRQTRTALQVEEMDRLRYHTYKAINAMQETLAAFRSCGCKEAEEEILKAQENLKQAASEGSIRASRILLYQALERSVQSLRILEKHQGKHGHTFSEEFINRIHGTPTLLPEDEQRNREAASRARIDESLEAFKASLQAVIETVDCEKARSFLHRTHQDAHRALERSSLSSTQKYYQEETRRICAEALAQLGDCE